MVTSASVVRVLQWPPLPWALTALLAAAAVLTGCGSAPVYQEEAFLPDTPYRVRFDGSREVVCDSVKRALLNQGYVLESPLEAGVLNVSKAFQRDKQTVTLRVQSTCMDNGDGSHTVFASAQEEVTELQPIKQPLGVNVGGFGGITFPSGSARVPVTVKRQTVQDHDFYARLYKQIGQQIAEARRR